VRRSIVALSVLGLLAGQVALGAGVPSPSGTWFGRFVFEPHDGIPLNAFPPLSSYPTAKLVVGQAWVTAHFSGITQAAHDAPDARSTCSMRLRFSKALSSGGWRAYEQAGKISFGGNVSGGPPERSACQGAVASGQSHVVLRMRRAGAKLKAEFGQHFKQTATAEFGQDSLRAYLHH
jgi:hypothetical protein